MNLIRSFALVYFRTIILIAGLLTAAGASVAQSTDQNFPSPVTGSEVEGSIRARDIGDSRLTSHFWAFDGSQGDIFINVVTTNFSGDIDVYQADSLKPLTKMVLFADAGTTETGRVIYMRQPGRLLLRVEGRSPNDDPARYTIKFAGSFVALAPQREVRPPTVGDTEDTGIRVNSVGTIVAVRPRPTPTPPLRNRIEGVVPNPSVRRSDDAERVDVSAPKTDQRKESDGEVKTVFSNKAAKVAVSEPENSPSKPTSRSTVRPTASNRPSQVKPEPAADPLANVRLVIQLKDGNRVEKAMTEVLRFTYDRGFLTVIAKDGGINRYSMANVASVTVQ